MTMQTEQLTFNTMKRPIKFSFGLVLLTFLILVPAMMTSYWVGALTMTLMLTGLAQGWNLIAGYAGYLAFGNVAFFGLGAYATGILTKTANFDFLSALAIAIVVSSAVCAVFAPALMRLKGHYFALVTIGLALGFGQLFRLNPFGLAGNAGTMSVPGFQSTLVSHNTFAYLGMLLFATLASVLGIVLRRTRFGYALYSVRTSEMVASTAGINVLRYKVLAWVLSAGIFAGIGGIWATWIRVITPDSAFSLEIAIMYSVIALLGGLNHIYAIIGSGFFIGIVGELFWSQLPNLHLIVMGTLVMLITIALPAGIAGLGVSGAPSLRSRIRDVRKGIL